MHKVHMGFLEDVCDKGAQMYAVACSVYASGCRALYMVGWLNSSIWINLIGFIHFSF